MGAPYVLIGGAAAVALYASQRREGGGVVVPAAPIGLKPIAGASVSLKANSPGGLMPVTGAIKPKSVSIRLIANGSKAGNTAPSAAMDTAQRAAEQYVQQNVDKLSDAAKKAGAAKLNEALKINPPLTGNESYKDIAKIAGGIAGAAGCSAVPGGATVAPLCAIAGAYLGVKGAELAKKAGAKIEAYAREQLDAIGDKASKVWNSIF